MRDETLANLQGRFDVAAAVIAKIEDECLGTGSFYPNDRRIEFIRRALAEREHVDVAD